MDQRCPPKTLLLSMYRLYFFYHHGFTHNFSNSLTNTKLWKICFSLLCFLSVFLESTSPFSLQLQMGGKTQSAIICVSAAVLKRHRSRCLEMARGSRVCGISPWMADRDWKMKLTCLREIPSECWGGAWTIQVRTWNWVSGEDNS